MSLYVLSQGQPKLESLLTHEHIPAIRLPYNTHAPYDALETEDKAVLRFGRGKNGKKYPCSVTGLYLPGSVLGVSVILEKPAEQIRVNEAAYTFEAERPVWGINVCARSDQTLLAFYGENPDEGTVAIRGLTPMTVEPITYGLLTALYDKIIDHRDAGVLDRYIIDQENERAVSLA